MTTVYVYGYSDPSRWAGFASYQQLIDFLDSQHPNQIEYDQGGPTLDPPYEVDPSLQTLLSSPEFRDKLGRSVKEAILKDQNLTQAFAKFINEGGTIVFTPPDSPNYNQQYAHWVKGLNGDPPYIEMPQSFATPAYGTEARSVFALAHEIYHNEFQMLPGGLTTVIPPFLADAKSGVRRPKRSSALA